jgi:hypothetical protein
MNSRIHPIETVINLVKKIHKQPRADGAPYWTHPLRCHGLLLTVWKEAPFEAEIAMLFHDTLEDVEGGEEIILEALELSAASWPGLDKHKAFKLVQDLTTPQGIPGKQAISEIEQRFRGGCVDQEAYLLKSIDMMDNTADLISFYRDTPDHPEIPNHLKPQRLQKYRGYLAAIKCGQEEQGGITPEELPGFGQAVDYVMAAVSKNLQEMERIIDRLAAERSH